MNIKSLTLKNKLTVESTGEQYFDLTAPSFRYKSELGIRALHYIKQDQVGRMDKVSLQYFGKSDYVDALCIVNNIFNPFSLNEGDVIIIPNLSDLAAVYSRPNAASRPNPVLEDYVNTDRQSEKDQARVQRLAQKAKTKESGVDTPIPPNMLQQGQESKIYEGGNITLGANLPTRNNNS